MIITIVGGGSTFTPGIVKSIALRKEELEVDEIRLFGDVQGFGQIRDSGFCRIFSGH